MSKEVFLNHPEVTPSRNTGGWSIRRRLSHHHRSALVFDQGDAETTILSCQIQQSSSFKLTRKKV